MDEEFNDMVEHDCEEHAEYYEFIDELVAQGVYIKEYKYHGYECGICGRVLQTGQELLWIKIN